MSEQTTWKVFVDRLRKFAWWYCSFKTMYFGRTYCLANFYYFLETHSIIFYIMCNFGNILNDFGIRTTNPTLYRKGSFLCDAIRGDLWKLIQKRHDPQILNIKKSWLLLIFNEGGVENGILRFELFKEVIQGNNSKEGALFYWISCDIRTQK